MPPPRRLSVWAIALSALVLGGLVVTACGSNSSSVGAGDRGTTIPAGDPLPGTSWDLVSYQGMGRPTVPAAKSTVATLAFGNGGTVNGSTGCNQFGGTYEVDGSALTITLGPMTQMACADPAAQAQESALVALFPAVAGFDLAADQLVLTDSGGNPLLTYVAGLSSLEGTSWKVTGVNNGRGAVESTALTEALTLDFAAGGTFSGSSGCNRMGGTYATSGTDGVTFTDFQGTLMACADDVMALEAEYIAALQATTTYAISGDQLTLRNTDGATQVTLTVAS